MSATATTREHSVEKRPERASRLGEPEPGAPLGVSGLAGLWGLHLLCLVVPATTIAFLSTGPHPWYVALAFVGVLAGSVVLDNHAGPARAQPAINLPSWPFDGVLYLLVGVQLVVVALFTRSVAETGLWSFNALVGLLLVGTNSGYSAIVVAHELIHRKQKHLQGLGRLLLATVLYEHFSTEHVRGHHARVGTTEDPATARFGETYNEFFRRTVPAQFWSAWRLEKKRLGDADMKWNDRRMLVNRVVHGLLVQAALVTAVVALAGWQAGAAFVLQAFLAIRLLEAVNYFEHYGLSRASKRVRPVDSWDTESWFTLYTLVGLSRHADHHAFASRPYQKLRHWEVSPKLPRGYFGMVQLVLVNNEKARRLLGEELERRELGPFAESEEPRRLGAPRAEPAQAA